MNDDEQYLQDSDIDYDGKQQPYGIDKAYQKKRYIVTNRSVYQPFFSVNVGYYAKQVYYSEHFELTIPGRVFHVTAAEINKLVGRKLLSNF